MLKYIYIYKKIVKNWQYKYEMGKGLAVRVCNKSKSDKSEYCIKYTHIYKYL